MLDYAHLRAGEPVDRVAVMVTFMRMPVPAPRPPEKFPEGATLARASLTVAAYRALYHEVGAPWLWWLREVMPDDLLAKHLESPLVSTYVLSAAGNAAGFFELDRSTWPDVNINYFGLVPAMIGHGFGKPLLRAAINEVALMANPGPARRITVNTCTADHPRALPNYLAAGFVEIRRLREVWDIPRRLGLSIPDHLRA
jgi:GNAT superfamily N-acetyltransferase